MAATEATADTGDGERVVGVDDSVGTRAALRYALAEPHHATCPVTVVPPVGAGHPVP